MDFSYIARIFPALMQGAGTTLLLFALVFPFSLPLGFLITLCANCRFRPVKWIAQAYIFVMRGTPLMLQLFFFYFGLPFIPGIGQYLRMSSFTAAVLSFTLNYAAYFAEIFRGGLLSIDKGQYEVSHVLGLNSWQTMTRVIIPQMIRVTLPSIGHHAGQGYRTGRLHRAAGTAALRQGHRHARLHDHAVSRGCLHLSAHHLRGDAAVQIR
mgnify:CR=1 FL=1